MRKFGIFILSFILLVNYLVMTPFAEVMIANNDNNSVEERQEIASQIPPIETEKNTEIVDTDVILDSNTEETLSKQESTEKKKRDVIKEESKDIASGIQGTAPWRIDSEGTLRIGGGKISASSGKDRTWTPYALDIKKIIFENKVTSGVNIDGLFMGLKNVKKIENISYLDTSGAAYLSYMFMDMESLEALDLSSWDVSNCVDTMSMFANTHSLKNLNISNWDVSKVTNMYSMFWYCGHSVGLTSLEISNWDVSKVTNMRSMFKGINISSLDLSDWDVSKVSSMNQMFNRAKFKQLDLSAWNPLESRDANEMFFDLPFLSQIKLGSYFNFVGTEGLSKNYSDKWRNVGLGTEEMPQGANTWTSKQLMQNYDGSKDADTYIWINELEVETKTADIPLGTNVSDINPQDFIESVKLEGVKLSENEYTTKVTNNPKTTQVGSRTIKIEVTPKVDEPKKVEVEEAINILWGSTLVAKDVTQTSTDASISLLHNKISGKPILNANEGNGFSSAIERLTVRPILNIYRSREENLILRAHYNTIYTPQEDLAQRWNGLFSKTEINYGDVVGFQVLPDDPDESYFGKNTFVSRNNELVTETVGYEWAYYELTTSGYRLMHFNQLIINNDQKVKLNTSKEEMNRNISNFIILSKHIENPNDFRMEFESVDTTSSGNKKSTINVYETLESGGEFKTTYEVTYTVNPEVTESYYDVNGKQIEQSQTTEFNYGQEFTPNPEEYIENNGELYIYKGWVDALPGTGTIIPQEGVPEATKVEKNYYYIYDKADKFINVTLPTEVIFGTFENNNKISSQKYEIKNNSDELPVEVSLEQFDKVKSDIKLLSSDVTDPTQEEASAKLNLCVDNESVIPGLTEATPTQIITKIDMNASRVISLEGTYFGNMSDKNILDYKMHLKFKATQDNKN